MNSPKYCFDTHPLVWYFTKAKTLSKKAKEILDKVFLGEEECFIPVIVLLEIFHLSLKFKKFNFPKFLQSIRLANIIIVPLDKVVLESCFELPNKLDIHDRIIMATSEVNDCVLVTKDRDLRNLFKTKTIW